MRARKASSAKRFVVSGRMSVEGRKHTTATSCRVRDSTVCHIYGTGQMIFVISFAKSFVSRSYLSLAKESVLEVPADAKAK
jgi:hypothetical protein